MSKRTILCALAALFLYVGLTTGDEGRIPIYQPTILDANNGPIDGKYVLTRNIEHVGVGAAIQIIGLSNEQVEIDLNGFTITTSGETAQSAIRGENLRSLTLRNGTVVVNVTNLTDSIRIVNTGRTVIEDITTIGGTSEGIELVGVQSFRLVRNTVITPGGSGIRVEGAADDAHGSVEGNLVRETGEHGIHLPLGLSSAIVRENQIERSGLNGIHAAPGGALIVENNAVELAGRRGIFVNKTTSCRVSDNVVRGAGTNDPDGGDGIYIATESRNCMVRGNTSNENAGNGLRVSGDFNHLQDNVTNSNQGAGLWFQGGGVSNTFGGNTARGNGTPTGNCATQHTCPGLAAPDFCDDASGNRSFKNNLMPGPDLC